MSNKRIFLILLTVLVLSISTPAQALWLSGYEYRKEFSVNNSNLDTLNNYQLLLNVYKGSGTDSGDSVYLSSIKNDFSDIRFTNAAGYELDYWIEEKTDGSSAQVWIEFDSLAASSSTDFYVYYNNDSASSASNGFDTFAFFDDFERNSNGDPLGNDWIGSGTSQISTEHDIGDISGYTGTRSAKLVDDPVTTPTANHSFTHGDTAISFRSYKELAARMEFLHGDGTGRIFIKSDASGEGVQYYDGSWHYLSDLTADAWGLFEITDIDWSSYTYDVYYNSVQIGNDLNMQINSNYSDYLVFYGSNASGTGDVWFDDVKVRQWTANEPTWLEQGWGGEEEIIPEPASLLLLGFGVFGIAVFRKGVGNEQTE